MDQSLLEICREIVSVPSVTDNGTRVVAEYCLGRLMRSAGIQGRLVPSSEGPGQVNLLGHIPGADSSLRPVVLNTHLDTVPPGENSLWQHCNGNPFDAVVDDDRIYGLGAADTKLDFVAKLTALRRVGKPNRPVFVVGTFGEEHGLRGAKEIVKSGLLPAAAMVFIGEPSGLEAITANRGFMTYRLEVVFKPVEVPKSARVERVRFVGRAAHSSTPHLGENAILKALRALVQNGSMVLDIQGGDATNKVPASCAAAIAVGDGVESGSGQATAVGGVNSEAVNAILSFCESLLEFAERAGPEEPDMPPPTLTANPAIISRDENRLTLEFEVRPPPSLQLDTVRNELQRIIAAQQARFPSLKFELIEIRANPGFRSKMDCEIVSLTAAAMAAAHLSIEFAAKKGCTEAGIYAAAGFEPLVFGPGPSVGVIHAPDEYNLLSEVEGAIRFYEALLTQ